MREQIAVAPTKARSVTLPLKAGDLIYWCACVALSAILSVPFAHSFESPTLILTLLGSALYLLSGAVLALTYCWCYSSSNWTKIIGGSLLMLLASATTFSIIQQNTTLIVFMSLFGLPGTIFGGLRFNPRR